MVTKTKTKKQTRKLQASRGPDRMGIEVVGADKGAFESFAVSVSNPWRVFLLGLLRGAGFGFGALVGGAILLSLLTYLISVIVQVPFFGEWFKGVIDNITGNMVQ